MFRTAAIVLAGGLINTASIALTKLELDALRETVHEMCLPPDRQGDYLKVEGEAKARLAVPVKLVKGGLVGKISYDCWKGIPIALDQYKTDPRQCAIEMTKVLVPILKSAPLPKPAETGFDTTRSRDVALLLGYDAALALARAQLGEDISQNKATLDERLRLLGASSITFTRNPVGDSNDAAPADEFARHVIGPLSARSTALERSFQLGWIGVISLKTPSLSFPGFSVSQFARDADFRWTGALADRDLLEKLVTGARNTS